jgi:chromosome segregation ATPase
MLFDSPRSLILMTVGAFLVGWLLSAISSRLGNKYGASKRDPRDGRIRSLEAELRVAQSDADKLRGQVADLEARVREADEAVEQRDNVIAHQQNRIEQLSVDLKDSVRQTRELRAELTERATENVRSEVKLREVETELELAHASTDLIATGVFDYAAESDNDEDGANPGKVGSSSR